MKNRTVLGIFFFLLLMTSTVFGSMVENSRQGLPAISAESRPAQTPGNAELHQGLSLVLLEIMADSLIGFNGGLNLWIYANNNPLALVDPFGLAPTFGECLWRSISDYYGLTAITGISGLLAIPITKPKPGALGGSITTNVLSELGSFIKINSPLFRKIVIEGRATPNLLRLFGRVNPYLFPILLGVDAAAIGKATYDCMNEPCQKP